MDSGRQVIRWSIPGWLFIFSIITLYLLGEYVSEGTLSGVFAAISLTKDASTAIVALIVTSGIPIGFVIYQVYYAFYGTYPFGIVSRDRGYEVLKNLQPETIEDLIKNTGSDFKKQSVSDTSYIVRLDEVWEKNRNIFLPNSIHRLKKEYRGRKEKKLYRRRIQINWAIVVTYMNYIVGSGASSHLRDEYDTLSDIYHALGAARTSVLLSGATIVMYNFATRNIVTVLASSVVVVIVMFILMWILETNRRGAQLRLILLLRHAFHLNEASLQTLKESNQNSTKLTTRNQSISVPEQNDHIYLLEKEIERLRTINQRQTEFYAKHLNDLKKGES